MLYGIKETAAMAGITTRALRYYDRIGLLHPHSVTAAGYRCYGEKELELLQQILFYRERGFPLQTIRSILYREDFDLPAALEEHLQALQAQKARTEALIGAVQQTIAAVKGERTMENEERFAAFRREAVEKNEAAYGAEARQAYGDEAVDEANRRMLHMDDARWARFQALEEEIRRRLECGVQAGLSAESDEAREIVRLHREWLLYTWKSYSPQAHKGVAALYVSDPRFTAYYDRTVPGCAAWLAEAIQRWAV